MPPSPSADADVDASSAPVKPKKASQSKAMRAGLIWPVARVNKEIVKHKLVPRVGGNCAVFLTGALEAIAKDLLVASERECANHKRKRITSTDVLVGLRSDDDLHGTFRFVRVYDGTTSTARSKTTPGARRLAATTAAA